MRMKIITIWKIPKHQFQVRHWWFNEKKNWTNQNHWKLTQSNDDINPSDTNKLTEEPIKIKVTVNYVTKNGDKMFDWISSWNTSSYDLYENKCKLG